MTNRHFSFLRSNYSFYLSNSPKRTENYLDVLDKFTGNKISQLSKADRKDIDSAISLGYSAKKSMAKLSSYERRNKLSFIAQQLKEKSETFARVLTLEVGKPIRDSRTEVLRSIDTFQTASEESIRIHGEYLKLDTNEHNTGYEAIVKRFPIGLISMIIPYNFPLNLAAHKIAPAIASGCPFLLKPSDKAPLTSIFLAEILSRAELPNGAFSVLPCDSKDAELLVTDDRIDFLSFTGSAKVGWSLKEKCGKKSITMELGGIAACVVDSIRKSKLSHIAERVAFGAFSQAGQSCISVQRVFVHEQIYEEFKNKLVNITSKLKKGNPMNEDTFIGPLITIDDSKRCSSMVQEATARGAKILVGGSGAENFFDPTVVENPPLDCKLVTEEVFGPVCTLEKYTDFKEVIAKINKSKYGLQSGLFTEDLNKAFYAYDNLEVGGVVINEIPSKRIDSMPYGGVKNSGLGKEGVKDAIESMTVKKIMLLKDLPML